MAGMTKAYSRNGEWWKIIYAEVKFVHDVLCVSICVSVCLNLLSQISVVSLAAVSSGQ